MIAHAADTIFQNAPSQPDRRGWCSELSSAGRIRKLGRRFRRVNLFEGSRPLVARTYGRRVALTLDTIRLSWVRGRDVNWPSQDLGATSYSIPQCAIVIFASVKRLSLGLNRKSSKANYRMHALASMPISLFNVRPPKGVWGRQQVRGIKNLRDKLCRTLLRMGFLKTSFRVFQDITSLGGTALLRQQQERYGPLLEQYNFIRSRIDEQKVKGAASAENVRKQVDISRLSLNRAAKLLRRLCSESNPSPQSKFLKDSVHSSKALASYQGGHSGIGVSRAVLAGASAGTAAAASSWGLVQIIGHASTAASIGGLHGAAAASAGWAWFGGGSLAAGGGGMAAGHLVLPGIGTVVMVAVSSVLSHKEAKKLEKTCDDIQIANRKNQDALTTLSNHVSDLKALENRLFGQHRLLADSVDLAYRRLLRFGFISHLWRIIRSWFSGSYFKASELSDLQQLRSSVQRFMSAFS